MRKIGLIGLSFILLVLLVLTGCETKPDNITQEVYDTAKKVLEVSQSYIDLDLTADEAYDKIGMLHATIKENTGTTASEVALIEKIGDLTELLSAAKIAAAIDQSDSAAKAYKAIQERHNEITKIVNGESFGY